MNNTKKRNRKSIPWLSWLHDPLFLFDKRQEDMPPLAASYEAYMNPCMNTYLHIQIFFLWWNRTNLLESTGCAVHSWVKKSVGEEICQQCNAAINNLKSEVQSNTYNSIPHDACTIGIQCTITFTVTTLISRGLRGGRNILIRKFSKVWLCAIYKLRN